MDPVKLHIHKHPVTPLRSGETGYCCGIKFEAISNGYYCEECEIFIHKICSNTFTEMEYLTHQQNCNSTTLSLSYSYWHISLRCALCGGKFIEDRNVMRFSCRSWSCDTTIHLYCAINPPPEFIEVPQNHDHKLKLEMVQSCFNCNACGKDGDGYPYKCHECDLKFHVNCERYEAEVHHTSHSLHTLKLVKGEPPAYSDGTCRLCGKNVTDYEVYYHCSICNFTLDLECVRHPPPIYLHDLNTHDHNLTLVPKYISFTCTTCGLHGDRSPYVCLPCDFMSHKDCSKFPWVININRHDHRVSRTSLVGVVNAVCGVCQKKMDWSCGGYTCKKCPKSVFHTKCATRKDVTDGKEMKDEPDEDEDTTPFIEIDANTIQHFLHRNHNLRLDKSGIEARGDCKACSYPIYHDSFYSCMACEFIIHRSCANLPKRKWHVVLNKPFLLTRADHTYENCDACGVVYNGFTYYSGSGLYQIDVRCASVTEPFFHQSHPHHPLFYTSPTGICTACNKKADHVLRCVEDDCEYILDFKCAVLPYVVKHRVDEHFLSLSYGEKDAIGKYWCDICEKETDPNKWFYTSEDYQLTLHTDCVLGDVRGFQSGRQLSTPRAAFDTVRNNGMSRPLCYICESRCIFPIFLKLLVDKTERKNYGIVVDGKPDIYYCSVKCSIEMFIYPGRRPNRKSSRGFTWSNRV